MEPGNKEILLAKWASKTELSAIQKALSFSNDPDFISFGLGVPAAEFFPINFCSQIATQILNNDPIALQYAPATQELKVHIVKLMLERGVNCDESQIFLTSGAQQGINLLVHLLLNPQREVIVEELAYSGFLQAIEPFQPKVLTISTDKITGINVDEIESILQSGCRPAFMYVIADGGNPLGINMSEEKRIQLVKLARDYGVPIIEDDPYGNLYYENILPCLKSYDDKWVFYIGTFSKILAPALRVGWIIVPEQLMEKLAVLKEGNDLNIATFSQKIVSAYLDRYPLTDHLNMLRHEYKLRRDAMISAIKKYLPSSTFHTAPKNGFFIWVELHKEIDTYKLLKQAIEFEKVAFIPGQSFSVIGNLIANHCMRLNFANCDCSKINEGIQRLANAITNL